MNLIKLLNLNKRQKFVFIVLCSSLLLFSSMYLAGAQLIISAFMLAVVTDVLLFLILRNDVKGTFYYPILILPFLYSISFSFFYSLIPARFLTRIILTAIYSFGLYSLYLTQNIFAISGIRTINLLRSARIVSFVLTIVVLFFLTNIIFSLRLPFYLLPILVFFITFLLSFQSLWTYSLDQNYIKETSFLALFLSLCLMELSAILSIWPINASIYSIFITGIFYAYSGLSQAWIEKRLFKGILWEYVWVGFLSVLILFLFAKWGI